MFFPEGQIRVRLYGQPCDMRKSFDGLQALVRQGLHCDPLDGSLYVFVNRRGVQMRVLYFDRSGFCIWAKRLEAGRFIADWTQVRAREMDWTALKLLLEGIEPGKWRKRYRLALEKKTTPTPSLRYDVGMSSTIKTAVPSEAEMNSLTPAQWLDVVRSQANRIETLEQRLAWFERQVFGSKSERLSVLENALQLPLAAMSSGESPATTAKLRTVSEHTRRVQQKDEVGEADSVPFFDETRVPVETITVPNPHTQGLTPDQYEVISAKVTYRLAQRPGSYVMLKYVREVIKLKQTQAIHCPPAPVGVLEGSRADVSFLAGLLLEKFTYYAPLYRQHQRLQDNSIRVTRPWLTQLTRQSIGLLEPVYAAQLDSVRASRVIAMDETPIKAGRSGHGKMKTGYFWPIYGEQDEVCFPFFPSRGSEHVRTALGLLGPGRVLLTDGYAAYEKYARKLEIAHAQCWVHCRRTFFEALQADPEAVEQALKQIAALYKIEDQIREQDLSGEGKRQHRLTHSKPKVEAFFEWIDRQFERQGLLPSSPFTQALGYARERRVGLEVFLEDPDVQMDTNHLERALRVIPRGRSLCTSYSSV